MVDTQADLDEYSYYLGVFCFLGVALVVLAVYYQAVLVTYPPPLKFLAWGSVTCAVFTPFYFQARSHWLRRNSLVSLRAKKAALIVAFVFYVLSASVLTVIGGGINAGAANLLVLTSGLSVYIAKAERTKWVIGIIALACYAATAVLQFDRTSGLIVYQARPSLWVDCLAVVVVFLVTGVASGDLAERRHSSP